MCLPLSTWKVRNRSIICPLNRFRGRWTIVLPYRFASRRHDAEGGRAGDGCDVLLARMTQRPGEHSLVRAGGEIERRVAPDVGDRPRGEEEQRAAVLGLADAGADQVAHRVGGEEGEGRFLGMLRVPGRPVRVNLRVRRRVEQEDDGLDRPAGGGQDLHVEVAGVPVPQGLPQVQAVHHAGGELLRSREVRADGGAGLVADVLLERLDPVVLRRPRAHPVRVPSLRPALPVALGRPRP